MRYRLCTLLIVLTIACFYFGWIGHTSRQAAFHRREQAKMSQRLSSQVVFRNRAKIAEIESLLAARTARVHRQATAVYFEDDNRVYHFWGNSLGAEWETLAYHQRQAIAYEQARFCPWRMLRQNEKR